MVFIAIEKHLMHIGNYKRLVKVPDQKDTTFKCKSDHSICYE